MNQDSSFPPMLPPSTELGAILFAVLPCLQEAYRPLASFAYHMTELTKIKNISSVPPLTGLSGIESLITDKDIMLRSLSFYGRMFRMPLLSTIATLLQGMQFYQTYKDILPGLFSGLGGFSGVGGTGGSGGTSPDLFSMLGGLSPDLLSGLFSGFSGDSSSPAASSSASVSDDFSDTVQPPDNTSSSEAFADTAQPPEHPAPETTEFPDTAPSPSEPDRSVSSEPSDDLFNSLYSFLTPEQQKIYEQLMHTD